MSLFEVAITQKATKAELDAGNDAETLVFGPRALIAKDQQAAAITGALLAQADGKLDLSRIEVKVRPF